MYSDQLSNDTIKAYERHINAFEKWLAKNHLKHIQQNTVDRYIREVVTSKSHAENTIRLCIAALKYKVNQCEKLGIAFKKSGKQARLVRPHKAFTP